MISQPSSLESSIQDIQDIQEVSELMDGDSSSLLNDSIDSHNTSRCSGKSSASKSSRGGGRLRRGTLSPASMKEFLEKEAVSDEMPDNIVLQNHWPHQNLFAEETMDTNVDMNVDNQSEIEIEMEMEIGMEEILSINILNLLLIHMQ